MIGLKDKDGETALQYFIDYYGNVLDLEDMEYILMLLHNEINIIPNGEGTLSSPLCLSVKTTKQEIVQLLINNKANLTHIDINGMKMFFIIFIIFLYFFYIFFCLNYNWRIGHNALHYAIELELVSIIELLLQFEPLLAQFVDQEGCSPLFHALRVTNTVSYIILQFYL